MTTEPFPSHEVDELVNSTQRRIDIEFESDLDALIERGRPQDDGLRDSRADLRVEVLDAGVEGELLLEHARLVPPPPAP